VPQRQYYFVSFEERGKGEKTLGVFCSRDKRLQASSSGDRVYVVNPA